MTPEAAPERLKKRPEFLRVAAANNKFVTPGLILQALPHGEPGALCRIGFTVTRKVGNSVARNRARRRLRAIVAERAQEGFPRSFDLVVIGRTTTLDRPYADLKRDLAWAMKRLNIT